MLRQIPILLIVYFSFLTCQSQMNGEAKQIVDYYSSGEKKSIVSFDLLSKKKCTQFFYENGQLMKKYCKVNDTLEGPFEIYYENGRLESRFNYLKGKIEGVLKSYHENGKIKILATYKKGKQDGEKKFYSKTGKIKAYNYFINDFLHYKKIYNYRDGHMNEFESYQPQVKISRDTISMNEHLEVAFLLPLPDSLFSRDSLWVNFDFMGLEMLEKSNGIYAFPDYRYSLSRGRVEEGFYIDGIGNQVLYGYISFMDNGEEVQSEVFEKRFYVKNNN